MLWHRSFSGANSTKCSQCSFGKVDRRTSVKRVGMIETLAKEVFTLVTLAGYETSKVNNNWILQIRWYLNTSTGDHLKKSRYSPKVLMSFWSVYIWGKANHLLTPIMKP